MSSKKRITIAISTYNRPDGLKRLIVELSKLLVPQEVDLRVVISDNSISANAESLVLKMAEHHLLSLIYHHVPERGIIYPRNMGLNDALENNSDYIMFIDDDEVPGRSWVKYLYEEIIETRAAVVSGGVVPSFQNTPSWWIEKGKIFEVMNYPEKVPIKYAHTSNSIVDLEVVRSLNLTFDDNYNLSGGEDTDFFKKIRDAGFSMYFTSKALVVEEIVSARVKPTWILKRWFRTGNTDALIQYRFNECFNTKLIILAGGMARVGYGFICALVKLPLLLVKNPASFECIRIGMRGLGFISAITGYVLFEYKKHDR